MLFSSQHSIGRNALLGNSPKSFKYLEFSQLSQSALNTLGTLGESSRCSGGQVPSEPGKCRHYRELYPRVSRAVDFLRCLVGNSQYSRKSPGELSILSGVSAKASNALKPPVLSYLRGLSKGANPRDSQNGQSLGVNTETGTSTLSDSCGWKLWLAHLNASPLVVADWKVRIKRTVADVPYEFAPIPFQERRVPGETRSWEPRTTKLCFLQVKASNCPKGPYNVHTEN